MTDILITKFRHVIVVHISCSVCNIRNLCKVLTWVKNVFKWEYFYSNVGDEKEIFRHKIYAEMVN